MKFRGIVLLLGGMLFVAVVLAQNSGLGRPAFRSLGGSARTH